MKSVKIINIFNLTILVKLKKFYQISFFTYLILHLLTQKLSAEDIFYRSEHYNNYGITLLKENNKLAAIEQFIKALISDPGNALAKKNLLKIAKSGAFKSHGSELKILRLIDLIDYIDFLHSRIIYLESQNDRLIKFIFEYVKDETIVLTTQSIQNDNKDEIDLKSMHQELFGDAPMISLDQLDFLNENYLSIKDRLVERLKVLQGANDQLRAFKISFLGQKNQIVRRKHTDQIKRNISSIQRQLTKKDEILKDQEQILRILKEELDSIRKDFALLNAKFQQTDQKVLALTKELAGTTLELYEKDQTLMNKSDRISTLEKDLLEAKERLSLVQRIIKDKDDHIDKLEEEMLFIQKDVHSNTQFQKSEQQTIKRVLSHINKKLKYQTELNLAKVNLLEQQLLILQKKYNEIETAVLDKDKDLSRLEKEFQFRGKKLSNLKKIATLKDQKVFELNGVVELYKGRLIDTLELVKEKEERILQLEKQIHEINSQFNDFDIRTLGQFFQQKFKFISEDRLPVNQPDSLGRGKIKMSLDQ